MDLKPAKKELKAALESIDAMKKSKDYNEYEQKWRNYLNHLEKSFEKLKIACKPVEGKFISMARMELSKRSVDPLLRYLKQARNADNHTINEVSRRIPSRVGVSPAFGDSIHINRMILNRGRIIHYDGSPFIAEFYPESAEVISIINRGSRYDPPKEHLGTPLLTKDPTSLAEKGYEFYKNLVDKVESKLKS